MAGAENSIPKILIVDDVDTNRQILKNIIQEMNCQPILAENGVQALKFLERIVPQLIVTDIAMPQMDGYELCENIKNDPKLREIPVIFISAFDNPQDVVKGYDCGCEDYIVKPFIPEVVKARVGVHLKLSEATKTLQITNKRLKISIDEQIGQMEKERKSVLYALLRVAKACVTYNELYMQRVCQNCRLFAEAMQLSVTYGEKISDTFVDVIELAAPLSDLGNVAIPTSILLKQGALDEAEKQVLMSHAAIGAQILDDIRKTVNINSFLDTSIEIAANHHENWDGSGYPAGKREQEIPISAQVVGLISDYCSLTQEGVKDGVGSCTDDAMTPEDAIEKMENSSGIRYNPELFDILKKIYRQLV